MRRRLASWQGVGDLDRGAERLERLRDPLLLGSARPDVLVDGGVEVTAQLGGPDVEAQLGIVAQPGGGLVRDRLNTRAVHAVASAGAASRMAFTARVKAAHSSTLLPRVASPLRVTV